MKRFIETVLGAFGLMLVSTARADAEMSLKSAREANEFLLKQVEDVERENADLLDRVRFAEPLVAKERLAIVSAKAKRMIEKETAK